jgi:bifunctional ADP-heptose synthase (sugar kinase/adenylyltransferase)
MLSDALIEHILAALPGKTVGLLGDLFLDRYLDIDAELTEPSVETGLDAYQVVGVRSLPGALGTVINNLAALGVGRIVPFTIVGDDGEGYELRQALAKLPAVSADHVLTWEGRRTPTYTKPMLCEAGRLPRELNRLDIKNRTPTPEKACIEVWRRVTKEWGKLDALIVLDQVSEEDCGVVTADIRQKLSEIGRVFDGIFALAEFSRGLDVFALADSRERIGLFRGVHLKPNVAECLKATGLDDWSAAAKELARRCGRAVFCTRGGDGIAFVEADGSVRDVPAFPVSGPIDVVGAGDSCSAGITCAMVAGASPESAAAFGNLIASITVQQLGTTGTASPAQVRERWREVSGGRP